jgi:phospholipid-transporting ATPase
VGDIIQINKDQQIPCDILVLFSSEEKGNCFIETKNLDGETNLKEKRTNIKLLNLFSDKPPQEISALNLEFQYEKPNPYLYNFAGKITLPDGSVIPLDNSNFVLRGCSLRNTDFIYGLVSYNGHESKIMLNSVNAVPKISLLEKMMNKQILRIVILQASLCLSFAVLSVIYQELNKAKLKYMEFDKDTTFANVFWISWTIYLGKWLLILNNFIPISLMVSHEMVKFVQARVIMNDKKMDSKMYGEISTVVQSSSLTEELGQLNYIFSDKTGTLTCNIMDFKKLYCAQVAYGTETDITDKFSYKKISNVNFKDARLFEDLKSEERREKVDKCLLFLGLCHTALIEGEGTDMKYCTSSPDELALVNFANFAGYVFKGLDRENFYNIEVNGVLQRFELLYVLEFNSKRKRMSVILKDQEKKIIILTKGADSIIAKRLKEDQKEELIQAMASLEEFGTEGLRTLMLAQREIPSSEFSDWEKSYHEALTAMTNREERMEEEQDKIEVELEIVGCTAIEDKLQDEVPETIELLAKANIKLWVLTGDKGTF